MRRRKRMRRLRIACCLLRARWRRRGWLGPRAARELGAEDGFQTGVGSAPMGRSERGATGEAGGGRSAYLHEYKGSRYMYISNCRSDADQKKMGKTLSIQTMK